MHKIILCLGNIDDVFEIQSDGLIVTRSRLDREIRSRYILTVEVEQAIMHCSYRKYTIIYRLEKQVLLVTQQQPLQRSQWRWKMSMITLQRFMHHCTLVLPGKTPALEQT